MSSDIEMPYPGKLLCFVRVRVVCVYCGLARTDHSGDDAQQLASERKLIADVGQRAQRAGVYAQTRDVTFVHRRVPDTDLQQPPSFITTVLLCTSLRELCNHNWGLSREV